MATDREREAARRRRYNSSVKGRIRHRIWTIKKQLAGDLKPGRRLDLQLELRQLDDERRLLPKLTYTRKATSEKPPSTIIELHPSNGQS